MPNGNGKAFRVKDERGKTSGLVCLLCPAEKAAVVNRVRLVPEDTPTSTYRRMVSEMERHLGCHEMQRREDEFRQMLRDGVPHTEVMG